ncbi:hypothetical protein NDA16_004533 [Ustilago loliicola]|nr:hypothetical protein NDA16_004533 [Ustilago loliicola]
MLARSSFHSSARVAAAVSNGKPKVLLLDQIKLATTELSQLAKVADVVESTAKTRKELIDQFKSGGEYSDVVGIYRHFGGARSIKIADRFDPELVSQLPESLRYIVHNGAGYDQLDVQALSQKGVQASNVPTAVDDATSDVALYLLLGALRRFPLAKAQMKEGKFNSAFPFLEARDPRGKTLGIVGAGGIGRAFAYKASYALGMKVMYHNRNRLSQEVESEAAKGGMQYVKSLDELLQLSDVVSLHCPLTPATKGLIGRKQLEIMKKDAILINTARGPVVKEEELAQALEEGIIAGAGLDVFEAEPKIHDRLLALKDTKVELLPHVGTLTLETQTKMEAVCLRNLIKGLETAVKRDVFPIVQLDNDDLPSEFANQEQLADTTQRVLPNVLKVTASGLTGLADTGKSLFDGIAQVLQQSQVAWANLENAANLTRLVQASLSNRFGDQVFASPFQLSINTTMQSNQTAQANRTDQPFWFELIEHNGRATYNPNPDTYQVFRNVKDFGAKGDGVTDDTDAINKAISTGSRCGEGCGSSTISPAVVYFPPGTYLVSSPIISYYYTQLMGSAADRPTLLASPQFQGIAVIDEDPYGSDGNNWYINQNNFFRAVFNFRIDLTQMPPSSGTGIHHQVSQATGLFNVHFEMRQDPNGNGQQGVFIENGSGGFMADLSFRGGRFGGGAANSVLLAGSEQSKVIQSWVQGSVVEGDDQLQDVQTVSVIDIRRPASLVKAGSSSQQWFSRNRPQYEEADISDFVNVKDFGCAGDGVTDDSQALQTILDASAGQKIVYVPHGTYYLESTVTFPPGTRIVGEVWPVLMGGGALFQDASNPQPVIRVGEPGDSGIMEISDMIFSTRGPAAGAIIVEWNIREQGGQQGSAAAWDSHIRVGGFSGTNLEADKCARELPLSDDCRASFLNLHLTPGSSAYLENMWVWTADHDLDYGNRAQTNLLSGRGVLIESSQGPVWMYGGASEHAVLYQYNIVNANNIFISLAQTETAYFQGKGRAVASQEEPLQIAKYNDPNFDLSTAQSSSSPFQNPNSTYENRGLGMRIANSTNTFIYGAGFYSFFDNYDRSQVSNRRSQKRILWLQDLGDDANVWVLNLNTVGVEKMVTVDGKDTVDEGRLRNGFGNTLAVWATDL